ncbi:hypothetical protein J8L86_20855 [Shewanella sp. MMG014]|uniref:hypothetical protein n=1 Tax=Shewanella sp. MMG014 TaxID=2822691 RepID=UPI001B376983|nr:hypothetical protein [Shewanella sp. MMG014]MBQ4892303.1 hypothetical protein [Shewanella sp. MMG014]
MKNKLNISLIFVYLSILIVFVYQVSPWTFEREVENNYKIIDLDGGAEYIASVSMLRKDDDGTYIVILLDSEGVWVSKATVHYKKKGNDSYLKGNTSVEKLVITKATTELNEKVKVSPLVLNFFKLLHPNRTFKFWISSSERLCVVSYSTPVFSGCYNLN